MSGIRGKRGLLKNGKNRCTELRRSEAPDASSGVWEEDGTGRYPQLGSCTPAIPQLQPGWGGAWGAGGTAAAGS